MLAPSQAWYEAVCRVGARVRFLVEIYDGANTWKAVGPGSMDPASDLYDTAVPVAVQKVAPVGSELDPFSRHIDYGEMFVDVADVWIRPLLVNYRLKGQRINIRIGAAELDEADFIGYALNHAIEEVQPDSGHTVTLICLGQFARMATTAIHGAWVGVHPLEALYDGAGGGILEKGGAVSFDTHSFKPADDYADGDGRAFVLAYDASDDHEDLKASSSLAAYSNNYQLLPDAASEAVGDGFLIGNAIPFESIVFDDLQTGNGQFATWGGDGGKYQYSTGEGTWSDVVVVDATDTTAQDGKRTLQAAGEITFDRPNDWVQATYDSQKAFWIRYNITAAQLTQSAIIDDTNKDEPFIPNKRSHLRVMRIDKELETLSNNLRGEAISESVQSIAQAETAARLLNGHLVENEDGAIEFVRFDVDRPAVQDLTADDIIPGTFQQESLDANVVNRVMIGFARNSDGKPTLRFCVNGTLSQTAYAFPGESKRIIAREFTTEWVEAVMALAEDIVAGDNSLVVRRAWGLCGNREEMWATVSEKRPVWLILDSRGVPTVGNLEFVYATALAQGSDVSTEDFEDPETGTIIPGIPFTEACTVTSVSRAQLGSAASTHLYGGWKADVPSAIVGSTRVLDITSVAMLAEDLCKRFAYGCPIISFDTPIRNYPLQLGDVVTAAVTEFVAYGIDGASTETWEIIGKEADLLEGVVRLTLASAVENAVTLDGIAAKGSSLADEARSSSLGELLGRTYIAEGMDVVLPGAGFVANVEVGVISNGVRTAVLSNETAHTFAAGTVVYVYAGFSQEQSGRVTLKFRQSDRHLSDEVLLATVTTGGGGITTIDTTGVDVAPIVTERVAAECITENEIGTSAVTTAKIAASAVTADEIGASAVTETKVASGAVTTVKVANYAIGVHNTVAETAGRNHGHDFNDWSRG